jgi:type I restriction-modification system DNA methylase subunit
VRLAKELQVSEPTLSRWITGKNQPRPVVEGRLRDLYSKTKTGQLSLHWDPSDQESGIRDALNRALRELREILHRRSHLSSRNEALEEVSKLLFAHFASLSRGGDGFNGLRGIKTSSLSENLRHFVNRMYSEFLPKALADEMPVEQFQLKLKVGEDLLASEILDCFEAFSQHTQEDLPRLSQIDVLNDVFGTFLADSFADEKQLGQYLTPTEVVGFMVRLGLSTLGDDEFEVLTDPARVGNFGIILDPSCGVGSFLTEVVKVLLPEVKARHGEASAESWLETILTDVLLGIDKSERMIRFAISNIALFGVPKIRLHHLNSLATFGRDGDVTKGLNGQVSLIFTNPPFGAEFSGEDISNYKVAQKWARKVPATVASELLFMERYVDWLQPGGSCLAIVPDSILTNKAIFQDLREGLAKQLEICNVVSLPDVTFAAAGTMTKTSVLHFKKSTKGKASSRTYFAICTDVGYTVNTRDSHRIKALTGSGQLPSILEDALSDEPELGRRVSGVQQSHRWDATFHASVPSHIENQIEQLTKQSVRLSEVAELANDRIDPRRRGSLEFEYIEISDVDSESVLLRSKMVPCNDAPSRARKIVKTGDVLFSTVRPDRRSVGVVRKEQDGAICTTGFAVIRPTKIDSLTLAYLLKTDFVNAQVLRNNIGIAYPAIDEACLLDVLLPITSDQLSTFAEEARQLMEAEQKTINLRKRLAGHLAEQLKNWSEQEK